MAAILVAMGLIFSLIFHVGTKEFSGEGNKDSGGTVTEDLKKTSYIPPMTALQATPLKETVDSKSVKDMDGVNGIVPNDGNGNEDETEEKSLQNDFQTGSPLSSGVDNKGFLDSCETESGRCYPDQVKLEPVEVNLNDSQSVGVNCKPSTNSDDPESPRSSTSAPTMTLRTWLKNPHLYKVSIIFTCTFVLRSISYSYLPLFLTYRAHFAKESIAYLPLIMLSSGALSSAISKRIVVKIGGKWTFILSALLVIGAGIWFYFISESNRVITYPAVVLLGMGFSSMSVNSLAFATQLIGPNKGTSGVVFAVMTLFSYVFGGATVMTIQKLFPSGSASEDCDECGDYVRHVFSIVTGSLAAISLLIVLFFQESKSTQKLNVTKKDGSNSTDTEAKS